VSDRLRTYEAAIGAALRWLVDKTGFLLLGVGVYVVVGRAAEGAPLAAQITVLALVYLPLALLVRRLSKAPDETLAPFRRHGLIQPLLFVTGLWLAAVGWFAALAFVLDEHGVVDFSTRVGGRVEHTGQLSDFFVWQSFEQIPVLAVNDTLQWEIPLHYGGGAGWIALAFKVLIVLPLVPVFLAAWRHRRPPRTAPAAVS
jgi:hypothetical protein